MNITIVGAGNVGLQFAVHCAEKGHKVLVYSSKVGTISAELRVVNENYVEIHSATIDGITYDAKEAFENADVIFVTVPAFLMPIVAEQIKKYIKQGTVIGLIPGTGGSECAFKKCVGQGAIVFGLQRVPSVARHIGNSGTVRAVGYRKQLVVSSIPAVASDRCAKLMEDLFEIECSATSNYLNITLTPSNPLLHTTRLRCLFKDYREGMIYESIPLFYEDWTDETSKLLFECDRELQQVCHDLKEFDLSGVRSLKLHYESETPQKLTDKIRSIEGFKGLPSPMIPAGNGFIPDFKSRYFTADFGYGLAILVQIAEFTGTDTPNMKATLEWYQKLTENYKGFKYSDYEIFDRKDLINFYSTSDGHI